MKTGHFLTLAFALLAGSAAAQKIEQTRTLKQEEVPALIHQSFQKDFCNLPTKGSWMAQWLIDPFSTLVGKESRPWQVSLEWSR